MHKILKIESKYNTYDIEFISSIDHVVQLTKLENTITIIDQNVSKLYPELSDDTFITVICHEEIKNSQGTEIILDELIARKANINTKLIIIGGGILQDLAGYCASIYCRGLEYFLVPTTLLAQADSCIGGKTSLNYKNKKNILGTFYPPAKIFIFTDFINTLTELDYLSGWGEIFKFNILQNKKFEFTSIDNAILEGLNYKSSILKLDEFDKKERKFLNFGHTFGHALESCSNYQIPHGIAVILGCIIALRISKKLKYNVNMFDLYIHEAEIILKKTKISFHPDWFNFQKILSLIQSDKKNTGSINMVLIDNGPVLQVIKNIEILESSLNETYESIRLYN